jgi:hypothetical protein
MKVFKSTLLIGLTALFMVVFCPLASSAAEVEVYLEGAYDPVTNVLDVYIFGDFTQPQVISYGIKLDFLPEELAVISARKTIAPPSDPTPYTSNPTLWELGSDPAYKDSPDPVISANAVVFKGGMINEAAPATSGIDPLNLSRVFFGMVSFGPGTEAGGVIPTQPTLSLTYAEGDGTGDYKNFVRYVDGGESEGVVLDTVDDSGVYFRPVNLITLPYDIAEWGDANGDGLISAFDILTLRQNLGNQNARICMDCDRNGIISAFDILCIRQKL